MPDYSQNVKINIDLEADTAGGLSEIGAALTSIKAASETIENELDTVEDAVEDFDPKTIDEPDLDIGAKVDSDDILASVRRARIEAWTEIREGRGRGAQPKIEIGATIDDSNIEEIVDREREKFTELAEGLDVVEDAKERVARENEVVSDSADDTVISVDEEARAFHQLVDEGSDLADVKEAAAQSNNLLNKANEETTRSTLSESKAHNELADAGVTVQEAMDELALSQQELHEANQRSTNSISEEITQIRNASGDFDDLQVAKQAVSNANKNLDERNKQTAKSMASELDITEKTALSLIGLGTAADEAGDASRSLMRRTDDMTDSMRAADKVGGLFEDGLGSLSVNLGAFTVALRNFLTQVPLMVTGLGALASAAGGVAGAFIAAGGAIASVGGAGALGMAEQIEEEYSQIEDTGQALQVVMLGLKDMFREALAPIVENEQSIDIFRQLAEGTANFVSLVSRAINAVMPEIDALVDSLGSRLEDPLREFVESFSFMFRNLKDEFTDMVVGTISAINDLMVFVTKFTDGITNSNHALEVFTDSVAEMAKLGGNLIAGLIPVFGAFFEVVGSVAEAFNELDPAMVANLVTLGALLATVNKFGGAIGAVITLIPNLVFGMSSAAAASGGLAGSMKAVLGSMGGFIRQHPTMLGGLTSLVDATEDFGDEMNALALSAEVSDDNFSDLDDDLQQLLVSIIQSADSMDELNDELGELIVNSDLSEEQIEEMSEELRELAISAEIADEATDDIDIDETDIQTQKATGKTPTIIPTGTGNRLTSVINKFSKLRGIISGASTAIIVLVGLIGGLLVGAIANFETAMSTASGVIDVIGGALSFLSEQVIRTFITFWNAMVDIVAGFEAAFAPILSLFGDGESSGKALAAVFDIIGTAVEIFFGIIRATVFVLARVIRWIGEVIGYVVDLYIATERAEHGFTNIADAIGNITGSGLPGWAKMVMNAFEDFIFILTNFEAAMVIAANAIERSFINAFNNILSGAKRVNDALPKEARFDSITEAGQIEAPDPIRTREDVREAMGEGARVNREELAADSETFLESIMPKGDKNVNLEVDNSSNVDQVIDADPEDQAQLSRTVKDAVEEANSFSRRQQGGQ